jgi:ubiquinone/menaquinone biosynthesis C-methylase UbiE
MPEDRVTAQGGWGAPHEGWADVDRSPDAGQFVQYLDTMTGTLFSKEYKRCTFELLQAGPGHQMLDVGCGTGEDVRALAAIVGSSGRVTGVDSSTAMIAEARQRSDMLSLPVKFFVGDAHALEFPDGTFDGTRADRTLQHLEDPARAVAEMVRVTRSGGRLVLFEPDWETLVIDVPDRIVTRAILILRCDKYRQGWVGRQLYRLLIDTGLRDVAVTGISLVLTDYALAEQILEIRKAAEDAVAAGVIERDDAREWIAQLDASAATGRFFSAITGFVASARKV